MSIPREFIELLLAKIDIVDLINQQVPLRQKSGNNYFARCPFHQEKSASFSVSQAKQFYHCFGCGAHGNAIDFMMHQDHLSFPEAIETLAKQVGMEVPRAAGSVKKEDSLTALYDCTEKVAQYYYEQLRNAKQAIDYLKNRGISGKVAQQFQLGYAPPGWSHVLDQFGKSELGKKQLLATGLVIQKEDGHNYYDRFRHRIMFPIHDYRGRVIGFGGRVLDQGEPKYLNSPETALFQKGHELYGLFQALKANRKLERALIVEGYMDVVALFQHDISYAVATLGTATTRHHIQRLMRYTSELVFCFDGDEAGRTAAFRALQVIFPMMQDHLQVRFLFLPDGEDPDSLVRKEGKTAFEERLTSALSLSAFFFQILSQQSDLQTMEGRARFTSSALTYIKQVPAGILSEILLEELARRARLSLSELKKQAKTGDVAKPEATQTAAAVIPKQKLNPPVQAALALLVQHPQLASVTHALPDTSVPGYAFLQQLISMIRATPEITTAGLRERWRGQTEEAWINELACWQHTIPETGITQEFLGSLRQIHLLSIDNEINNLLSKGAHTPLSDEEKQSLSGWIAKKKALAVQT